jgi:hypothetical protein
MVELVHNGQLIGVYTSELEATKVAHSRDYGTFQIFPLGTLIESDYN